MVVIVRVVVALVVVVVLVTVVGVLVVGFIFISCDDQLKVISFDMTISFDITMILS